MQRVEDGKPRRYGHKAAKQICYMVDDVIKRKETPHICSHEK
jgi:hypothetical protein